MILEYQTYSKSSKLSSYLAFPVDSQKEKNAYFEKAKYLSGSSTIPVSSPYFIFKIFASVKNTFFFLKERRHTFDKICALDMFSVLLGSGSIMSAEFPLISRESDKNPKD